MPLRRAAFWRASLAALLALGLAGAAPVFAQEASKPPEKKQEKKEEKKDEKKKQEKPAPGSPGEPLDLAAERRNVSRVLRAFQDGFESKSPRRITELLDATTFYDFPRFEDLVTQFLDGSAELRMHLRESTSEVKGDKATLIVDAEMIFRDKTNPAADQRRRERVQFDFIRTAKGWKIYEINPRNFFFR